MLEDNKKTKVIVGLSGGVDSSVCCKLLLDMGYDVEGMFMRNWDSLLNNDILGNPNDLLDVCPQEKDYMDALSVANQLNIKFHRVDFVKEYWDNVFEYFLNEYKKGRTPNPDVMCNRYIKFDSFKIEAMKKGAQKIAMGHFAITKVIDGVTHLYKGVDKNKDQSYFLSMTKRSELDNAIFPLGNMTKKEVREIAKDMNFITANKKDSTGICFIGERNFSKFLSNYLPNQEGNIVSLDNKVIGKHYGLMNYTIGQRKGIGIGGLKDNKTNLPWFVVGKDLEKNELIVGQGKDNELLYSDCCIIEDVNIINMPKSKDIYGKFRYRAPDEKIHIEFLDNNEAKVTYNHVKSVTPGQILVLYGEDEECYGGGIIKEVYYKNVKRKY